MSITILQQHITKNQAYIKNLQKADSRYTEFQCLGPGGAVLHSIGDEQPSARAIADYFNSGSVEASVHMVLQPDGIVYQLAPLNFRLWHVGGTANNTHIGIEMTEPDKSVIWYDENYRVHIKDKAKALAHVQQTYACAVDLFAGLCIQHNWDPLKDGVILSHKECYKRGIGSNHGDPEHLWDALDTGYTMDGFRRDVAKAVAEIQAAEKAFLAEGEGSWKAEAEKKRIEDIVEQYLYQRDKKLKDNDCGEWSREAREWAISNGIIQGIGNGPDDKPNYAWEAPVTREQMVTMLYRFAGNVAKL